MQGLLTQTVEMEGERAKERCPERVVGMSFNPEVS